MTPAREKIRSEASEKISKLQKKQLQVMNNWQMMKGTDYVGSAYKENGGVYANPLLGPEGDRSGGHLFNDS